jgi:hypothetical protein
MRKEVPARDKWETSGIWMGRRQVKAVVQGYLFMAQGGDFFSLGQCGTVLQAEVYSIRECVIENIYRI